MKKKYSIIPFILVTFVYFIVGFLTTVNGQFQGPLKVAFLSDVDFLRNTLVTLISFFFFLGYLLNSSRAGKWINNFGYKRTMLRGVSFMILALGLYLFSSYLAHDYGQYGLQLGGDFVPYGYLIFLLGSYFMGTSASVLQVVINPYVANYDLPGTASVQRVNIVCAINSFGTTIAPFFVTGVLFGGISLDLIEPSQLFIPFSWLVVFAVLVLLLIRAVDMPDIIGSYSRNDTPLTRSIWSFRHLKWGVVAIFFYVGAEVSIGVNVNLHAMELASKGMPLSFFGEYDFTLWGLNLGIPALLATLYWGGFFVGRALSSFTSKLQAKHQLIFSSVSAIILTLFAIFTNNLWVLVSVGLFHSVMWGAVFTLAIKGLGVYTTKASGVFMMGVFGGAIFPVLQGFLADELGAWQYTWFLVVFCEFMILYYALHGSKIKD